MLHDSTIYLIDISILDFLNFPPGEYLAHVVQDARLKF